MADDRFEVGQLVKRAAKSASRRRPGAEYGMVVGVRGNAVDTVQVLKRLPGTRFWDETDNPSDPARDNVLLRDRDGVPTPGAALRATAYNGDCYAVSGRTGTWRKDECRIQDGGATFLEEDVATVLDHVHRSVRQRDLLREEQEAAREAPPGRRVLRAGRPPDGATEPEPGEVPAREERQGAAAAQLKEAARRRAMRRAGPERAKAGRPAEEPSLKSRLDALASGIRRPDTGHGGLGS